MTLFTLETLVQAEDTQVKINGNWVPARPVQLYGVQGIISRAKAAWLVFTGQVDAVQWPEGQ